jgi:hypothetical protein
VSFLTWDDWGGFDDHVITPNLEHTPDGVQLAYGPRVPLLMFGGRVQPGIDSRWNSHVSIGKTVLDLLGLPPLGVTRLDDAPTLVDLINLHPATPTPPPFGSTITQPSPPHPTPAPNPTPPPPASTSTPVGAVTLRDGSHCPHPTTNPSINPIPPRRLPARHKAVGRVQILCHREIPVRRARDLAVRRRVSTDSGSRYILQGRAIRSPECLREHPAQLSRPM